MDQVEIWDWGRIVDLLVGASCVWAACVKEGGSNGQSRDLGFGENHVAGGTLDVKNEGQQGKGAGGGRVCVRVGLRGHDDDDELY